MFSYDKTIEQKQIGHRNNIFQQHQNNIGQLHNPYHINWGKCGSIFPNT